MLGALVLFGGSASSLVWYAPQWLSYYNLAIGGHHAGRAWDYYETIGGGMGAAALFEKL